MHMSIRRTLAFALIALALAPGASLAAPRQGERQALSSDALVRDVVAANKSLMAARQRWLAARSSVSSSESLPDPMVMLGYKNDGFESITLGEMEGSEWMASASQTFPFWGKRSLRGASTSYEARAKWYAYQSERLQLERSAREIFLDLLLTYKEEDALSSRLDVLRAIESAALNRYAKGMSSQSDVIMAQAEKYMVMESMEMLAQRRRTIEAGALALMDKEQGSGLGVPVEPKAGALEAEARYLAKAEYAPMLMEKRLMLDSGRSMVRLAEKEYYPDFTLSAQVNSRPEPYTDMWQVNVSFNIPLYYASKQRADLASAVSTAESLESEADNALRSVQAEVRESYAMAEASGRLMQLYESGFIAKTRQSFRSSVTQYSNGKVEIMSLMRSLALLSDYEISYWEKFVQREKAIAKLISLTTSLDERDDEKE